MIASSRIIDATGRLAALAHHCQGIELLNTKKVGQILTGLLDIASKSSSLGQTSVVVPKILAMELDEAIARVDSAVIDRPRKRVLVLMDEPKEVTDFVGVGVIEVEFSSQSCGARRGVGGNVLSGLEV